MDDPLMSLPGYVLRRAANAAGAELTARLDALDLRQSDVAALYLLEAHPGIISSRLGQILDIQRANMVSFLGRLEDKGLIRRAPIDGRTQAIYMTDAGQKKLAAARKIVEAFEAELIARVPEKHRPHLLPALLALWR